MIRMNWINPKRLLAIFFFVVGAAILIYTAINALFGFAFAGTPENAGYTILGSAFCCLPSAIVPLIIGAFLWSGAKKDELRDLEIEAYRKKNG